MAIVNVTLADTFDQWRVKTNSIGTQTGDLTSLVTTDKTSIVAAINEIFNNDSDDMENLVDDITPQLGGPLDLNNKNIEGSGSINITGAATFGGSVSTTSITSTSNASISVVPHGTGDINLESDMIKLGPAGTDVTVTSNGSGSLTVSPNGGGNTQPKILLDNVGDITLTPPSGKEVKIVGVISGNSVTQSASDNSTKIATTAYVDAQVATENSLVEMDDVTITTPTNNQTLVYNSATSKWVNTSASAAATESFAVSMAIALG